MIINGRFLTQKLTGVQRFAWEISKRLLIALKGVEVVSPKSMLDTGFSFPEKIYKIGKLKGHLWEQVELPLYSRGKLLLNLANTAPIFKRMQIVTIHDLAFLRHPECFSPLFSYWYRILIPKIAKNSEKILTVSEFSKKEIEVYLGVRSSKIEIIYNGVSDFFFYDPKISKENVLLTVSSLDPRKNLIRLILAFKKLKLRDYKLVIVGVGSKVFANLRLSSLLKDSVNIELVGYVSDGELRSYYQKARLFIYPSIYEGFGLPPLEAMACGTPVIVSNVASLPEVCGDAAYYINPFSVDDIANGIRSVLRDDVLQKELISKGLKRVKRFTWENSVKRLVSVIEELGY